MMNGAVRTSSINTEGRVTFVADASHAGRYLPQIASSGNNREFDADDMPRVLDFDDVEGLAPTPRDGSMMVCENAGSDEPEFPTYHLCLRGGYIFYFDKDDVEERTGPYPTYTSPPVGVIPLEKTAVEFPPGGRRVFREHAHSAARTGYELVILHVPEDPDDQGRPPAFLVADSMGKREKWANAIKDRAKLSRHTILRGGYSVTTKLSALGGSAGGAGGVGGVGRDESRGASDGAVALKNASSAAAERREEMGITGDCARRTFAASGKKNREKLTIQQQVLESSEDTELAGAVMEFGAPTFSENEWIANYFQVHNDFDAPTKCRQMEQWQAEVKRNLKGAVLEQYEYFVQASGEMTSMGREVTSLKTLVETQVETIKEMKEIDFSRALRADSSAGDDQDDDVDGGLGLEPGRMQSGRRRGSSKMSAADDLSEISSVDGSSRRQLDDDGFPDDASNADGGGASSSCGRMEVPDWLDDVGEDMAAIVRECRYNEAVELHNKAKAEMSDLMEKHERPISYRLTRKQLSHLEDVHRTLDNMAKRISGRLEETLRRKNEALRQASKRERSDLGAAMASLISPCALNDDAIYLQLLVRLGRTQQAAEAYSTRRSLLLLETLHERPISGAGTVDLVIYAAQLSQSFFSCLAGSVEGFLDLFILSPPPPPGGGAGGAAMNGDKQEDVSLGESSLHSHSESTKGVSAGAVASVVLWCDSELSKFASAFGGTRVLANLALSPPPRDAPKRPRVVGQESDDANGSKERRNAIEVAAQCVDQAFLYASQNLDSVGLPLTPRLAEYIRSRLKGCEAEVSRMLDDRWQHLTSDWRSGDNYNGLQMNQR